MRAALVLCAALIAGWTLGCGESVRAGSIAILEQHFGTSRHESMTRIAVAAWVNASTIPVLEEASLIGDTDPGTVMHSEAHFDNCYWDEGRDWVIQHRATAVAAAVRFATSGSDDDKQDFFDQFGYALHAVEDHYAHSNWVETREPGELAPLDVAGEPAPAGWFSGTFDNEDDTGPNAGALHCPEGTPHHDDFSKDSAGTPEAAEAFFTAVIAVQDQFEKITREVRAAVPDDADRVLSELGFIDPPATTRSRETESATLMFGSDSNGFLTPPTFCAPGTWANGFEQRVEPEQGDDDDTSLNAIALICANQEGTPFERLSVWEGEWGVWSDIETCPGSESIVAGALKVEPDRGDGDDTAANAIQFACAGGALLTASNNGPYGAWSSDQACAENEAICGLSVRTQVPLQTGDETAISGVLLHCCSLEDDSPASGGSSGMGGVEASAGIGSTERLTAGGGGAALGCGCRIGSKARDRAAAWLAIALLGLTLARRSREN